MFLTSQDGLGLGFCMGATQHCNRVTESDPDDPLIQNISFI